MRIREVCLPKKMRRVFARGKQIGICDLAAEGLFGTADEYYAVLQTPRVRRRCEHTTKCHCYFKILR